MYKTITQNNFIDAFQSIRPDNFTHEGLRALFDHLEQLEEDCGQLMELDVIAFCCEYSEYENLGAFRSDYGDEYETIEDVWGATTTIGIDDDSFIIQCF